MPRQPPPRPASNPSFPDRVTARLPEGARDRIDSAADSLNMPAAEWVREVLMLGLEAHDERQQSIADGVIEEYEPEPEPEEPQVSDEDYAERVDEGAAEIRKESASEFPAPPTPERINPRDCVHPPGRRNGPTCGVCGLDLGRRVGRGAISSTGRYVGRRS